MSNVVENLEVKKVIEKGIIVQHVLGTLCVFTRQTNHKVDFKQRRL